MVFSAVAATEGQLLIEAQAAVGSAIEIPLEGQLQIPPKKG